MSKFKWTIILTAFLLTASQAYEDCEHKTIKPPAKNQNYDRSWIKSKKPIFLTKDGKIYKTLFNLNKLTLLADHKFNYISEFKLSPDTNYIYCSGHNKWGDFTECLYNLISGEDFELTTPARITKSEFSPDSKKIILLNNNVKERQQNFAIMNLENKSVESIPYPIDFYSLNDFRSVEAKWSLDSRYIYLGAIAYPDGAYFKYDSESKQTTKIDGRYHPFHDYRDAEDAGIHFIEDQKELPFYRPLCLQWQCGNQGKAMSGVKAVIDKDYNLKIITSDGKEVIVDKGEYNQCEGITIRILSWLEDGKYLIYQHPHDVTYIYGVEENKISVLFDSGGIRFGWEDSENRETYPY